MAGNRSDDDIDSIDCLPLGGSSSEIQLTESSEKQEKKTKCKVGSKSSVPEQLRSRKGVPSLPRPNSTSEDDETRLTVKVVVIGDGAVGKTCLVNAYARDMIPVHYEPTVFDAYSAQVDVNGQSCSVRVVDTAGQEDYERLRTLTYFKTDVFVLCYSVMSVASLENCMRRWVPEIQRIAPGCPFLLVGCKVDLRDDLEDSTKQMDRKADIRPLSRQQGNEVAQSIGAHAFVECSAFTRQGVKDVFDAAILNGLENIPVASDNSCMCCTVV